MVEARDGGAPADEDERVELKEEVRPMVETPGERPPAAARLDCTNLAKDDQSAFL